MESSKQQINWSALSEEQKQKHTYWACSGKWTQSKDDIEFEIAMRNFFSSIKNLFSSKKEKEIDKLGIWVNIHRSKEEAEAYASRKQNKWKWDKQPAFILTLQEAIQMARENGYAGVKVMGYEKGEWVGLKSYPIDKPLL